MNRLDEFTAQTEALISRYEEQGILRDVDASQHRDLLIAEIAGSLDVA